jgi:hypothetical protein
MATVRQYIQALQDRQVVIARKFGAEITHVDKQYRVMNLALLALLAVLIKTLVDKGVITDAELTAVLNTARDDNTYPEEPTEHVE